MAMEEEKTTMEEEKTAVTVTVTVVVGHCLYQWCVSSHSPPECAWH